jgi:hypothetical protein|tara:strand:+ start:190 stop:321 length:132 start_codon:yes stop_codon:yes gene_type:complete
MQKLTRLVKYGEVILGAVLLAARALELIKAKPEQLQPVEPDGT